MGYRRTPKVYNIRFADDSDYPGLEATLRSYSVGQVIAFRKDSGQTDSVQAMVDLLAERLVSWNLEDEDGTPVPTTVEAILREDLDMIQALFDEWSDAITGVSVPLEKPSPAGEISQVGSIPMEPLSPSLAS